MARKEICSNCSAKMSSPVSFCPRCGRPTAHATKAERLEFDLATWRAHVDRAVASGGAPSGMTKEWAGGSGRATLTAPTTDPIRVETTHPGVQITRAGKEARKSGHAVSLKTRIPKRAPRPPRPAREDRERVIVLDSDDPFAYTACTTCDRTDWIIRTTRNEDRTYNYWCLRCSRAFKTVVRLRHGFKPFIAAGAVVGGLAATSILMR